MVERMRDSSVGCVRDPCPRREADPKQSADSSSAEGGDDAAKDGSPPASFHSVRASPFTGSFVMMHPSAASGYSASVSLAAPVFVYPPANLNPG
eukprot:372293-Rhodomonas_salina.1